MIIIPNILFMPIFLKCGTAESIKEEMNMEVRIMRTKSRKTQNNNTPRKTKTARTMVPVDMEIDLVSSRESIGSIIAYF